MIQAHSSETAPHAAKLRRRVLRALFLLVAAGLLYLALAGLDWHALFMSLVTLSPYWLAASLAALLVALTVRAARWSMLLAPESGPCLVAAFVGEAIGDLGNSFLPARAGEAGRTVWLARLLGVRLSFVVGTAAVERVSDAIFLAIVTFALMLTIPQVPLWLMVAALIFLLLGLTALAILSFLPAFSHLFTHLAKLLRLPHRLAHRGIGMLHEIGTGSRSLLHHPARIAGYIGLTAALWVSDAAAILYLAYAFHDSLEFSQALLFLAALGLSSAVPSTPGYIGVFQFVAVAVLVPFGISHAHALAIVLVYQASTILLQLLWGGLGWLALQYRGVGAGTGD
ncbi:MAG TPA: lysylphosphatidylglycerol synthase transmembrane domain-containing protein [Gammaproteobacteria bacterium]|nr:lysylphosphatidylglycerol synthase transmembrane domain-containing protein [Gammaproteobacteria bacterium]